MLFGDIINENGISNEYDCDMDIALALENMELTMQLESMGIINEAARRTKLQATIKYAMSKFRKKERVLESYDKDIAKCDKVIEKLTKEIAKYDNASETKKIVNNTLSIMKIILFGYFTSDVQNSYTLTDSKGRKNDVYSLASRTDDTKISNMWELYKMDLVFCRDETMTTKKYLQDQKKKLQQSK